MSAPTLDQLRGLIAHPGTTCLSIYFTPHESRPVDDPARWKSCVKDARSALRRFDATVDASSILEPVERLDLASMEGEGGTIAVFRSPGMLAVYRLPASVDDTVTVARGFHLRPLLRHAGAKTRYYVLNLSHDRVGLFQGGATGLVPVEASRLPLGAAQTAGAPQRDRYVSPRSGGHGGSSVWHGQGKDDRLRVEDELKFVRAVDAALRDLLRDDDAPLLIASTERLASAFRAHCRYPHVLKDNLHGNFDHAPLRELAERARPLVAAHADAEERIVIERYRDCAARERVTEELSTIARHAVEGRIRDLLVDVKAHVWGRMDSSTGALAVHFGAQESHDEDVLDGIAAAVLLRGGSVHALEASSMPTKSPIAALLRW